MQHDSHSHARPKPDPTDEPSIADVTIRVSRADDGPALRRLAELDSRGSVDDGVKLLAERGGALVAALPLAGGEVVADPFKRTSDVARLLELRARQLGHDASAVVRRRKLIARIPIIGH